MNLFELTLDNQDLWQAEKDLLGLASWWLRPEYFEQMGIAYQPPQLPTERGFCPILLLNKRWNERSVCRCGLILPVRWTDDDSDRLCQKIPPGLQDFAQSIRDMLIAETPAEGEARRNHWENLDRSWRLVPGIDFFPDLSKLPDDAFTWESAAIPLAATLLLTAVENESPKSGVFASGAWKGRMLPIDGAAEKYEAVRTMGGKTLFLPEDGFLDKSAEEIQPEKPKEGGTIKIVPLPGGKRTLRETVERYCRTLCREPEEDDPERCERYYLRMPNDSGALQDFYRRRLAGAVAEKCRQTARDRYKDLDGLFGSDLLISWVSGGSELIDVAAKCFQPKKIALLYTDSMTGQKNRCVASLGPQFEIEEFCYRGTMRFQELSQFLRECFLSCAGKKILVDLTLGSVVMSLALNETAPKGAMLLYWYKEQGEGNRVRPLSTEPEIRIQKERG